MGESLVITNKILLSQITIIQMICKRQNCHWQVTFFWSFLDCVLLFCRQSSLPLLPTAYVRFATLTSSCDSVRQYGFYGSNLLTSFCVKIKKTETFGRRSHQGSEIKHQVNNNGKQTIYLIIYFISGLNSISGKFPGCVMLFSIGPDGDGWSASDLLKLFHEFLLSACSVVVFCFAYLLGYFCGFVSFFLFFPYGVISNM